MEHSRLKFEKSVFWRSCSIASKPRITLSMAKSACVYGRKRTKKNLVITYLLLKSCTIFSHFWLTVKSQYNNLTHKS